MNKYRFDQFNVELVDPIVSILRNTIGIDLTQGLVSVTITLETANAKLYGVRLEDMPLYAPSLDNNDIEVLVANKLLLYKITEDEQV